MIFYCKKFVAALILMAWLSIAAQAWASCGAASCPIHTSFSQKQEPGDIQLDYSYEYVDQSQARVGVNPAEVGEIRGHHDELRTLSQIQTLRLNAAATSRFSLELTLPFVHREHQHVHHHHGADLLESWNFDGVGDLTVLTHFIFWQPQLSLTLGGKLPTGKNNATGISQNEDGTLSAAIGEPGIQPGSGAYDFLAGISAQQEYAQMLIFTDVLGRFTGKGRDDYRLGNSLTANAGIIYPLTHKLGFSAQANLRYARPDDKGRTSEEVQKTGGLWLYATPGALLNLTDNVTAHLNVQIPIYQNVNQIQLASPYNLILGASYKFNIF